MTRLDWIVLGVVTFTALLGLWQGFVIGALSAAGVIAGGFVGARIAPHLLPDGPHSPYTPVVALAGAAAGAILFEVVGSSVGTAIRRRLPPGPLRTVDSVGGFAFGALAGLALVWILAAVALQLPGQRDLRREVQQSRVLRELNDIVPPQRALRALARVDPFPEIAGPAPPSAPPDSAAARDPDIRRALPSVVRVLGTACGLGVAGSGWVAAPGIVVTNAHVVAGQRDTTVDRPGTRPLVADVLAFDVRNDIAILRVRGRLRAAPLRPAQPGEGNSAAIVGYPENGPLTVQPARVGRTAVALSEDAYGHGPVPREITSIGGNVRPGNSGGPVARHRGPRGRDGLRLADRGRRGLRDPAGHRRANAASREGATDARAGASTGDCVR